MAARLHIALGQFSPQLGVVEPNLSHLSACVDEALARGADLLLTPELGLTGYLLRDLVAEVALERTSPRLAPVAELSRRLPLTLGFVERAGDGQLYNACGYFEDGELRHVHRKVYLPTYGMFEEGRFFARGDRVETFDTAFGRLVMLNCEDIWHPSNAMLAQLDGAEGLILMSAAPGRGVSGATPVLGSRAAWHDILRTFSRLLLCWAAWSNRVGFEDGVLFSGGSTIYAPYRETPLVEAPMLAAGVTTAEVDREATSRLRAGSGQLREENPEVVRERFATLFADRLPEGERTP